MAVRESAHDSKRHAAPSAAAAPVAALISCAAVACCAGASLVLLPKTAALLSTAAAAAVGFLAVLMVFVKRRKAALPAAAPHSAVREAGVSIFTYSPFALAILDEQGRFREVNDEMLQLLGCRREELTGEPAAAIVGQEAREELHGRLAAAVAGDIQQLNVTMMHKTGIPLDIRMTLTPYDTEDGVKGAVMLSQDMGERKRSLERVRYMAYYDDMTGLPNRRMFTAQLSEALAHVGPGGHRVAVLYMDLDRFKLINDSFGRDFGDMLLMQVAERLSRGLSEQDLAARMEGDEFAILYAAVHTGEEALLRARALLRLLEEPFELQGIPFHVSASIGIAIGQEDEQDPNLLIKKADLALGIVKENGRNDCLLYSGELNNSSLEKLTMQHEMRQSLARGDFMLYYQPQYEIESGRMVGLEALVRWNHPEQGLITPGQFVPIAEESGLIVQLGDWVLAEACRQNRAWQEMGLPAVPVSVNLSMRQFLQQNLPERVAAILNETGLAPEYLELEITESMTMDVEHAMDCMIELTKLGVRISIDDFGTGYSSLHYLKTFPIHRLKIDRSFVCDIQQDPSDAAIVAAIIAMAHNLNMQVIAEGVETPEQVDFLLRHRCDEMQGYYKSPPVPEARAAELLREHAASYT